ncbi:glycosyltransferase family 4 protein [Peribacillus frigoritolerans]|uniref:glycosyltransferase family 4 protein n=1 Tax=Peribacillus castrilensis TaxID=2897690 RepID=UPI002DCB4B46|nr:glycosyltransferase family 4 protein [Peribacillus castrilensis]
MKKIKRICIIADAYPTETDPKNPFIEQLVIAFTELGIECIVLNPVSLTKKIIRKSVLRPKRWSKKTKSSVIEIYSPRYLTFSSKKFWFINTNFLNLILFQYSCLKVLKEIGPNFDAVYGHFIFPSGISANKISKKFNIPSFFAYGENTNYTIDNLGADKTRKLLKDINGVVAVSTANKENLLKQNIVDENKIGVFPNSINNKLFYKRDKVEMRKKYGLPENAFIVAFVGRFVDIKGANRLSEAIQIVGSDKVKSIFIGFGNVGPNCDGILFEGKQPHENIPELLSAADIFVLPTLAEGCCNSIIEAMACGLPIISSNRSFNDDILDETCSLRIDPMDINEIAVAIKRLYENEDLRKKLSDGSLKKAQYLNIEERSKNIIAFMEEKL